MKFQQYRALTPPPDPGGVASIELGVRYFAESPTHLAAWVIRGQDQTGTWADLRRFTEKDQFDKAVRDLYAGVSIMDVLVKAY